MMKSYIATIRSNLRLMGRDRSVLFFSILFPHGVLFYVFLCFHAKENPGVMSQVIAMVMIIGVLGSGFFGAGMRTVTDRETNVLSRFKVAPTNAGPIIVASMVSGLVAYLPTIFLFFFFAKFFFHAPLPPNLLSAGDFRVHRAANFQGHGHDCRGSGEFGPGSDHSDPAALPADAFLERRDISG